MRRVRQGVWIVGSPRSRPPWSVSLKEADASTQHTLCVPRSHSPNRWFTCNQSRVPQVCAHTFHCTSTEVVVVGFTARMTGGSSGAGEKKKSEKGKLWLTTIPTVTITLSQSTSLLVFLLPSSPGCRLSPSCRVVTASVSLPMTLSPTSLVASIRNLYDVKGFSLQTHTHTHTYRRCNHSRYWFPVSSLSRESISISFQMILLDRIQA